jgi:hypothetical protein
MLLEQEGYEPTTTKTKCALTKTDNDRLSAWQRTNLSVTWCEQLDPWKYEREIISAMQPPMNLAENVDHPFHATMSKARTRFRDAARHRME